MEKGNYWVRIGLDCKHQRTSTNINEHQRHGRVWTRASDFSFFDFTAKWLCFDEVKSIIKRTQTLFPFYHRIYAIDS